MSVDWLLIAAVLCGASVLFLGFSAYKYFSSRSREREARAALRPRGDEPESFGVASAEPEPLEATISRLGLASRSPLFVPLTTGGANREEQSALDQRPSEGIKDFSPLGQFRGTNISEAVCERVDQDRGSAKGLIDLVRALYLDQSNFTFDVVAQLAPEDRVLAGLLFERWLLDPSEIEYWEDIHNRLIGPPTALRSHARQLGPLDPP